MKLIADNFHVTMVMVTFLYSNSNIQGTTARVADGLVQRSFIHRYLARQPFLRFPKTKKLLDMARLRKTLKPHILGNDIVGTGAARQSGGTDAKLNRRGSHKPVRHVVAGTFAWSYAT